MPKTQLLLLAILASATSFAQTASRYDVVITEIMADPTPVVGLPNAEFIEIKNVSTTAYNLSGWRLSDATSTATITTSFLLQPDSAVILCTNTNVAAFSAFGRTIGVTSFPSLDNDGDVLTLRSPQGRTIHAVAYTTDWYANEAKKEGGWSMEIIDPKNPCTGRENWKASTNNMGGTPGKTNSVNGVNTDNTPPQLLRTYLSDSVTLMLIFNETVDSTSAANRTAYTIQGATVLSAITQPPLFQTVQLKLAAPVQAGNVFNITASNITDCKGTTIGAFNKAMFGLPQVPAATDLVINEILFNPNPGGTDYVEFYNKSNKIIDASLLYVANRNASGVVSSLKKLAETPFFIFPGDHLIVTEDKTVLQQHYLVKNEDAVLQLASLPSYPDDKGTVVLLSITGDVIDELTYEDNWHFGLITNDDGVALERINPADTTQASRNWHSAASSVGYGTPTYRNSQFMQQAEGKAMIELAPKIFSPDNDGRDDIATISYRVEEPGYVANIIIFDAAGRTIRHLVKNHLLSLKGSWTWDGLGENRAKLPIGTYIIYTEIFNLQGTKKSFKNSIVLARQMN